MKIKKIMCYPCGKEMEKLSTLIHETWKCGSCLREIVIVNEN
jgi:hypothetical protein